MICWYCYWGWPKPVYDIYIKAIKDIEFLMDDYPGSGQPHSGEQAMEYGPAHIVWSDENWDCTEFCIKECDSPHYQKWIPGVVDIVKRSLKELEALPQDQVAVCPGDYDDYHPENYPPPEGVVLIKRRG